MTKLTLVAREIQLELIKDFASKPELSDWWSRVCHTFFLSLV
jgi:hypothetical protein